MLLPRETSRKQEEMMREEGVVLREWQGRQKQAIGCFGGREGWMEAGCGGGSRIAPWMRVKLPRQLDHTGGTSREEGETGVRRALPPHPYERVSVGKYQSSAAKCPEDPSLIFTRVERTADAASVWRG